MASPCAHAKLDSGVPSERDHQHTKGGKEDAHGDVGDVLGIHLPALELVAAVISRQQAGEPDEYLSERGMHVEVKLALEVVRAELAKVRLVPDYEWGLADFVKTRPARKKGVCGGCDMFQVLLDELALRWGRES